MGRYLKQGFVRELEWKLNREEISYSKKNQNQNKAENITKNSMVNQKVEFNNKTI